jgi:DNA-binding transcriptional MerR regulator
VDKAPDAFRTISEVAEEITVPQHVLRFWESRFTQIRPMKRGGGRRYYRPDDVDLLRGVRHLLYGEGYTIRGVQRILREQGLGFVQGVWRAGAEPPPPPLDEDKAGDEPAESSAAAGEKIEPSLFAVAAPRETQSAQQRSVASAPAPFRLGVDDESRRKLQTVLDDLMACRHLIDEALTGASPEK